MRWRSGPLTLMALAACAADQQASRPARPRAVPRTAPVVASVGRADSLISTGQALYADEQFDSARAVWLVALGAARAAPDAHAEAVVLTSLGLAAWRMGDMKTARTLGEQALALKGRGGMTGELAKSYNALGLVALAENRNADAARIFQRAITAARAADDPLGVAKASGNIALAYGNLGDLPRAREGHRTMRDAGRNAADGRVEGNGLANEAMLDVWEGDPRSALARLDTARGLYRRVAYVTGEQNALTQLATAFELTGEYDRAFAALDTALTIARGHGLREQEAEDLRLIAGLHLALGDYRRALRYYAQADTLLRSTGLEADRGSVLRGAAEAHLRLGNTPLAEQNGSEALRLHTVSDEPLDQLDDLLLLAEVDARTGGLTRAEPRLRSARALAARLDTRGARVAVGLEEARLSDRDADPRSVLRAVRRIARDIAPGDFSAAWEANAVAARAYARIGNLDSAVAVGRRAVDAVEHLRRSIASEPLRTTFAADRADVYADLVLILLRLNRPAEAFAVADAARSRSLLEHLSDVRREVGGGAIPRELVDGDQLLRRIDALVQRLRETDGGTPRERGSSPNTGEAELAAKLADARSEYEALMIRAARRNPREMAMLGVGAPGLEKVRSALDPDELLVEYLLTRDTLLVFAVTRDGIRVVQTPIDGAALAQRVHLLRDLWGSPGVSWRHALPASRALHTTLVGPLRDAGLLRGVAHLLIVPHGILGQLAFAALQDERSGRFLVQGFTVGELSSAATLAVMRQGSVGTRPSVAAAGFAPFPDELPATAREVVAFRAAVPGAIAHLGAAASEPAARGALGSGGLVHVATHGILNVKNPMFSRIELARSPHPHPSNDGRLEVHEILGLFVRSPLVFLSGCETGAGQPWTTDPVRGTSEMTLSQAILLGGAANIISTLWRIDDGGAAFFADRFYRHLARAPVAEALALAQRETAADPRYASPFYWAGYTLSGEGRFGGTAQTRANASVQ